MGINIGKNSFRVIGLDARGAIVPLNEATGIHRGLGTAVALSRAANIDL
jgi:hypothetical protein